MNFPNWRKQIEVKETQELSRKKYMMGMYRYPEELPGVMKLLNDYITESGNNRNFGKTSGKE